VADPNVLRHRMQMASGVRRAVPERQEEKGGRHISAGGHPECRAGECDVFEYLNDRGGC